MFRTSFEVFKAVDFVVWFIYFRLVVHFSRTEVLSGLEQGNAMESQGRVSTVVMICITSVMLKSI